MKTYFVMDSNSVMRFRGTREECEAWIAKQVREWDMLGRQCPKYRVFYDAATQPCFQN
jgi:hypothetical protein